MKDKIIVFLILFGIWLVLVAIGLQTRADYVGGAIIAKQVYSVYLERTSYIHDVDMGLTGYNPEIDKSLGIEIDLLCNVRERNPKQCWYQMLYEVGEEFRSYRGW